MTDLISRADALEQMAQAECGLHYDDCEAENCSCSYIQRILDIPSADAEWIKREDALQARPEYLNPICEFNKGWNTALHECWENIKALPSAKIVMVGKENNNGKEKI